MQTLNLNAWGTQHPISFYLSKYAENNNLYVGMTTHYEGFPEPYGDLTVNLSVKCEDDCAFIDTNNLGESIIEWLVENNLAVQTGRMRQSGWCFYEEVRFNMQELMKYCVD